MAKDDFFLSFGTDANIFADKIESESSRASQAILHLTEALEDYDATVKNSRAGGPLQNLFAGLDDASRRFGALTDSLVTGFDKALAGVGELTSELAGLVDAVNKINEMRPRTKARTAKAVSQVQDDDVVATDNARRAGKALGEVVELNATAARNALKRVADINNTLARSANDAADPVSRLAKSIRDLSGASKEANGRGVVTGGGNITITGPVTMTSDGNLVNAAAATPVAAKTSTVAPISDQQADAVVRAEAKRRRNDPQAIEDLSTPAAPGLYTYPGVEHYDSGRARKGGRLVGADVREGESFQDYFARNDATRAKIEQGRSTLPTPDRGDLLKFNQFKASGGRAGKEFEGRLRTLVEEKGSSFSTQDTVKAHVGDLGLEGQTPGLIEAIQRILAVRERQQQHAQKVIRDLLATDPHTTFGGDVFGARNSDVEVGNTFPAALHRVDEELLSTHEGDPATIRAAEARRDAAERRRLFRYTDRGAAVDPGTLTPDIGTPEQEGLTLSARRKADAAARAEARKRNAEAVAALDPIDQEAVRARRQGNPELQRINNLLGKKGGLNTAEIADALGLKTETTRQPAADSAKFVQAALEREQAQTRLEAYHVDPQTYTERERQRLLAKAESFRNFDHPDSGKIAQDAERAAAKLTPESYLNQLHEAVTDATRKTTSLTSRTSYTGLTDDSEAKAREALENRRAAILEETSKARAATPTETPTETVENVTRRRNQLRPGPGRRVIYRGENPDAASAAQPGSGTDLRGRFFTEDLATAQEYAGPTGRVLATSVSEKTLERARRRAVQQKVLEGLVVPESVAKGAVDYDPEAANPEVVNNAAAPRKQRTRNTGALKEARARVEALKAEMAQENADIDSLSGALAAAEAEVEKMSAARAPKAAAAGGGGKKPPTPPLPPNAGPAGEEEPGEGGRGSTGRRRDQSVFGSGVDPLKTYRSSSALFKADYTAQIALLKESTQAILANAAARLQDTRLIADETERIKAQNRILVEAGAALKNDPAYKTLPNLETKKGVFAQATGLPPSKDNYNRLQGLFTQGGGIDASGLVNKAQAAAAAPGGARGAGSEGGTLGTALFGQKGFIDGQLRHIGSAIENFAGFQLVFTGFEKFKELVQTGLEVDTTFVRLNATLQSDGRSAAGLRSAFAQISSQTGEDLKVVVGAAAELGGVFKTNADLIQGVKVAAELANISQGTLTAKEAAIGLRDVTDAYAVNGAQGIRAVGDQIARLSVITGVSVKDITEGATQLAQEAHDFGLKQRQAVVLTSFVTKNTGESGEQAAEQTSRLLATLNSTKVQDQLVKLRVATREQFASGDIGGVLTNLLTNFDKLTPSARQSIEALVGAGRQARAFTGLVRDGAAIVAEFNNNQNDLGALAKQNSAILGTVGGNIKQLGEDFRNLGQTLQQLGVFDILGVAAKAVDGLLQVVNRLGQAFADVLNSNPITKNMKDLVAIILEAVVAFKILGPVASSAFAKMGIGAGAKAAEIEAATVAQSASTTGAGIGTGRGRGFGTIFTPARVPGFPASNVATGRLGAIDAEGNFVSQPVAGANGGIRGAGLGPAVAGAPFQAGGRLTAALGRGLSGFGGEDPSTMARQVQRVGTAATSAGASIQSFGTRVQTFAETSRAAAVGMSALSGALAAAMLVLPFVIEGISQRNQRDKEGLAIQDALRGDAPKDPSKTDPTGANQAYVDASSLATKAADPGFAERIADVVTGGPKGTGFLSRVGHVANTGSFGLLGFLKNEATNPLANPWDNYKDSQAASFGSGGDPSDKFNKDYFKLMNSQMGRLRGTKGGTPDDVKNAVAANDKEFKSQVDKLVAEAGDEPAQEAARAQLASLQHSVAEAGDKRLQINKGLQSIDVLNAKNILGIGTLVQAISGLNKQTLGQLNGLLTAIESDQDIKSGSAADKNFHIAVDPNSTAAERRRANISLLQSSITQGTDKLNTDVNYASGPPRDALISSLQNQAGQLQSLQQQELTSAQVVNAAKADSLARGGNPAAAAEAMKASVDGALQVLNQLDSTQPEYWQAITTLLDAEQKAADLAVLPAVNQLRLHSSTTLNSVTKAQDTAGIAQKQYEAAKAAAAASDPALVAAAQKKADDTAAAVADLTKQGIAPTDPRYLTASNDAATAAKTLADTKAQTGDQNPNVIAARIAKNEADLQAAQSVADQALSGFQLNAAQLQSTADTVGADRKQLEGLQGKTGNGGALAAAIANYGTNSSQANQIRMQIIDQTAKLNNDLNDVLNATLDLEIAQLDARGQKGDKEKAAADKTQQVQNSIDAYKKRTGDTNLSKPEGQRLQASLVTAQRSQFDVALQAQLDTLDFQKETYKITSSQEVQALQDMLKNKQNTLDQQRSLTLKIKGLQEQIRAQLTGSGFNIATDIKLPTINQVRRSLGGVLGNGTTQVVQANTTNTVSAPITIIAQAGSNPRAIANEVAAALGAATGQSVRANTPTPRLVGY